MGLENDHDLVGLFFIFDVPLWVSVSLSNMIKRKCQKGDDILWKIPNSLNIDG